jgi:hypothetical protein
MTIWRSFHRWIDEFYIRGAFTKGHLAVAILSALTYAGTKVTDDQMMSLIQERITYVENDRPSDTNPRQALKDLDWIRQAITPFGFTVTTASITWDELIAMLESDNNFILVRTQAPPMSVCSTLHVYLELHFLQFAGDYKNWNQEAVKTGMMKRANIDGVNAYIITRS